MRFYNLPASFPSDFQFTFSSWSRVKNIRNQSDTTIEGLKLILSSKSYDLQNSRETGKVDFNVIREQRDEYAIAQDDCKTFYNAIRKSGLLHFTDAGGNIEPTSGANYEFQAHGKKYRHIVYTYTHPKWDKGVELLHSELSRIVGKARTTQH